MLILGLLLLIQIVLSVTLIHEMRSLVAKMKFKKSIFAAALLSAFAASFIAAEKCCIAWSSGLLYSAYLTLVYGIFVGTFFFDRTLLLQAGKEKEAESLEGVPVFFTCSLAVTPCILAYRVYYSGYSIFATGITWFISIMAIFMAIVIYHDMNINNWLPASLDKFIAGIAGEEKTMKKSHSESRKNIWTVTSLLIVGMACVFFAGEDFGDKTAVVQLLVLSIAILLLASFCVDVNLVIGLLGPYLAILITAGLTACLGYTISQDWFGIIWGFMAGAFLGLSIVPWRHSEIR